MRYLPVTTRLADTTGSGVADLINNARRSDRPTGEEPAIGELINEDAWRRELGREEIFTDLREWAKGQAYGLDFRGWLDGGSGARIAHVQTRTATAMQHQILKLIHPSSGAQESANAASVPDYSPPAFLEHIVPSTTFSPIGRSGWWLNLQDVGGDDLDWWRQLIESVDHPGFGKFCATIVRTAATTADPRRTSGTAPA